MYRHIRYSGDSLEINIKAISMMLIVFLVCAGIVSAEEEKTSLTFENKMTEILDYCNALEETKKHVKIIAVEDAADLYTAENTPGFILARGKMPIVDTDLKRQVLFEKYQQIGENTKEEIINKYGYPNGPIIGQGYNYNGCMLLLVLEGSEIDANTLNSLYMIIKEEASKSGISDVPIVFTYENMPKEETSRSDYFRPVIGGIRVEKSNGIGATLSFPAKKSDGTSVVVISGHFAVVAGGLGADIWQSNSSNSTHIIGQVDAIGGDEADAAYVECSNVDEKVYISSTNWEPIVAWRNPWANGTSISKSGIKTGVTNGYTVDTFIWVESQTFGELDNQCRSNYSSDGGDSGSPVYHMNNNHLELIGIHRASSNLYSYFSPISGVMSDLNLLPDVETTYPKGDFNYDGAINLADLSAFALAYNNDLGYNSNGDFNDDGNINFVDLSAFALVYE